MIKDYINLTKPGIIAGNLVTAASGFFLGSKLEFSSTRFIFMLCGLCLIIASGCVFNNYKDRFIDQKMERTKARALCLNAISMESALKFGWVLLGVSILCLSLFTTSLALYTALIGFVVYVNIYTPLKTRSEHGTLVGSIAGAIPPVVGYTAASGTLDVGAMILFLIVTFWQMPHFYAIAIYRSNDYEKASIPVLPLVRGFEKTQKQMFIYTLLYTIAALLPYFNKMTGMSYLIVTLILNTIWLGFAFMGFKTQTMVKWAKTMFFLSLIVVMGSSFMMTIDAVK